MPNDRLEKAATLKNSANTFPEIAPMKSTGKPPPNAAILSPRFSRSNGLRKFTSLSMRRASAPALREFGVLTLEFPIQDEQAAARPLSARNQKRAIRNKH